LTPAVARPWNRPVIVRSASRRLAASRLGRGLAAFAVAAVVAGCVTSSALTPLPLPTPSSSPTATFPVSPVPGNSQSAPLPTDAPREVTGLKPLPSCGGEILFEPDPDISPLPTPPQPVTSDADNQQADACLIWAWENGKAAQVAVSAISDEQDEIYTIYRLPGNGTVDVLTRVRSHPDQVVTWTDVTCKQLSLQDGQITPADCGPETPIG